MVDYMDYKNWARNKITLGSYVTFAWHFNFTDIAKDWFAIQASAMTKTVNKCTQGNKDINERIFTPSLQELCTNLRKFVCTNCSFTHFWVWEKRTSMLNNMYRICNHSRPQWAYVSFNTCRIICFVVSNNAGRDKLFLPYSVSQLIPSISAMQFIFKYASTSISQEARYEIPSCLHYH